MLEDYSSKYSIDPFMDNVVKCYNIMHERVNIWVIEDRDNQMTLKGPLLRKPFLCQEIFSTFLTLLKGTVIAFLKRKHCPKKKIFESEHYPFKYCW